MKLTHLFTAVALSAASVAGAASDVNPANLYAYWPLNDATGISATCANNAAWNGTLQTGATWTTSKNDAVFGGALQFDGTAGYVALPGNATLPVPNSSAVSFSFWAVMDELPASSATYYRAAYNSDTAQDNYIVYTDRGNADLRMKVLTAAGGNYKVGIPSASFTAGTWFHAAFVYDGTQLMSYLNGTKINTVPAPLSGLLKQSAQDSSIGRKTNQADQFWKGKISDLAIFSRTLSDTEIQKIALGDRNMQQLMANATVSDWSQF